MRIIGHIPHEALKITIFKMDDRLSVKFETGLYEQIYKFRESEELKDAEGVRMLVDDVFIRFVMEEFSRMHRARNAAFERQYPSSQEEVFETII